MATILQHLGRFSFRYRRFVLLFWLLLVGILGALVASGHQPYSSQFSIPGTSSQEATNLLARVNPDARGGSGTVVLFAPGSHSFTDSATRNAVESSIRTAARGPGIVSVTDPYTSGTISKDGTIARASVTFTLPTSSVTGDQRAALHKAFASTRSAGLRSYYGGAAATSLSAGDTDVIGVLIALLVLTITFRSLLNAGMPLMSAILGVAIGLLGVGIANSVSQLNTTASTLAVMLGLAVGIDYGLFITTRYRSTVRELSAARPGAEVDRIEAIGQAVATAGSAVVFAGATVVIALSALSVCGIPFLTAMGLAGAGTIAFAVLIALTLVPALLGFAGQRAFKGKMIDTSPTAADRSMGSRWGGLVTRHRLPLAVLVVVLLGVLAIPVLGMQEGLPSDGGAPSDTTQRHAYDLTTRGFGEGTNGPLLIVARVPHDDASNSAMGVKKQLETRKDVAAVSDPTVQPGGSIATLSVIPDSGPSSSRTTDLVSSIRDDAWSIKAATRADVSVTGATATNVDIVNRTSSALLPYLLVVIALALVLLMIAFRSIFVPLTALFGFLLTMGASLGTVVLVFQHGIGKNLVGVSRQEPILSFLPILAIGVLFGLAMDYEVFLVSRMREVRSRGSDAQDAVIIGFGYGARVVTAAALIMIGVFASFVITDVPTTKSIGFTLAVGILFDAFLVRMILIPALMSMLGDRAWHLPRWLDKILPHVDLEGSSLTPGPRPSHQVGPGRFAATGADSR